MLTAGHHGLVCLNNYDLFVNKVVNKVVEDLVRLCKLCTNKEFSSKIAFDTIPCACTRLRQRLN